MTSVDPDQELANLILAVANRGPILGRFESLSYLGEGAFSIVFAAVDLRTNRKAVLKFVKVSADDYRRSSFRREAEVAKAVVGKRNIVQLVGELETLSVRVVAKEYGVPLTLTTEFIALERAKTTLPGYVLGHRVTRPLYRRLSLVRDVALGVERLHRAGYCHRDLKPDNILVFSGGRAKIGDLGTCRRHATPDSIGTNYLMPRGDLNYAAPEMFSGAGYQPELFIGADWFGVGSILFEMVTGQNLYVAIGLRSIDEIRRTMMVATNASEFKRRVAAIAGRYPIPDTREFANEPWLLHMSDPTHAAIGDLIRDLCNFDYERRIKDVWRIVKRLDIAILLAERDHRRELKSRDRGLPDATGVTGGTA